MTAEPVHVVAPPGGFTCDGSRAGQPHEPIDLLSNINRWTDCPRCRVRYYVPPTAHPDYSTATPRDQFGVPEFLEIEPIHTCNLRCVMCHVSYEQLSKVRLDPSFVEKVDGMEGKWAVVGGEYEPVAHPKIAAILRGLSDRGMKIDLTSNGTLFTEKLIDRIADCNIRRVTISFDGIRKETYEKIRRNANYEIAMRRILHFKERVLEHNPTCVFSVNYTVLLDNIDEMADAVTYWEEQGFDHVGFIAMVVRADTEYLHGQSIHGHLDRFQWQIDEAARRIVSGPYRLGMSNSLGVVPTFAEQISSSMHGHFVISAHPGAGMPMNPRPVFQNHGFPGVPVHCSSPYKAVKLLYDGTLQVCSKFTIGSIYGKHSFLDTWRGYLAEKIRAAIVREPKICLSCDYFRFCINAGSIDYNRPENFKFLQSSDPRQVAVFLEFTLVEWVGEYYLLKPGVGPFDPRFDDDITASTIFHCDDFRCLLVLLSGELAKREPRPIDHPSNRFRFWQVGEWVMAVPCGGFDGTALRIESLADLRFAQSMDEILQGMGLSRNEEKNTLHAPEDAPVLVDSLNAYNIVRFGGRFIGIPHAAGEFEVDKTDLSTVAGVMISNELTEIKRMIADAASGPSAAHA
jgi:MoaA/NifB/PqqE/SkfB family radical SAM enzyme